MAMNYPLVVGGVAAATLFGVFAPATMNQLPPCDAPEVVRKLVRFAKHELAAAKTPYRTIDIVGILDLPNESYTYTCKAALHVDGAFAKRIAYEVSWELKLLSRLAVEMRPAKD